jgi:hypothetical protein
MTDQRDPDTDSIRRTGPEERDYLLQRAEGHRQLAEKTEGSGAKMIHARMKQLYEERASATDKAAGAAAGTSFVLVLALLVGAAASGFGATAATRRRLR